MILFKTIIPNRIANDDSITKIRNVVIMLKDL